MVCTLVPRAWEPELLLFVPGKSKRHSWDRKLRPVLVQPYNWGTASFVGPMVGHIQYSRYRQAHTVYCSLGSVVPLVQEPLARQRCLNRRARRRVHIAVPVANTMGVPIVVEPVA